ncbi:FAD-dependent oxidoreductase [Nocardia bhagyanarayanae]|uniref:NADPH-dependent 2,4-dienoyl-CoA reductase/sulfur reductase-like enzyme n=1 Tax=Nocardia bhagyanarayanae TaxID=1215925 RepID=A0A543EXU3_9NOCA|nr:FAD-dependent oxidoreductase [Nocardia bhagyanarayanae]TQM26400.1 NADPH-dependent 2,4-dienoyl-CoA reductase/sulfur reductase-like enzyme [Nocardia bhagyanarayanae]
MKVVIVGGVAGGMSAATRLRRLRESAEIVVLERGDHVSFANCGLPYYLGGVIQKREALLLQTPESLAERFRLDVRVRHEVVALDPVGRSVTVRDLDSGREYVESFDELVLSTGAAAIVPPLPGVERALVLRDVADVDRVAEALGGARSAVVVGAGFIGVEMAENLVRRQVSTTVVERGTQVLAPMDVEMAAPVAAEMREHGVRLELGAELTRVDADSVTLSDRRVIPADLVVMAIGVRPESALAREAGLEIGSGGGIVVDERLRTSAPHIYAVGDVVEKRDAVSGQSMLVPLANAANRQGRLVADVIAGLPAIDPPAQATAILGVFDLTAATTGWSEKRLRAAGRPFRVLHSHPFAHAGYYPDARAMSVKLLVDPATDEILGAQAVGGDGVDKRIDVLATAMAGGIPASRLMDLELAYAPQFGSAKDPVNMLGYMADNLRTGAIRTVQWHEIDDMIATGAHAVDVRSPEEFAAGSIPGARNLPLDELRDRAGEIPAGPVLVFCQVGQRGNTATRLLTQLGRDAINLDGGYRTWRDATAAVR